MTSTMLRVCHDQAYLPFFSRGPVDARGHTSHGNNSQAVCEATPMPCCGSELAVEESVLQENERIKKEICVHEAYEID